MSNSTLSKWAERGTIKKLAAHTHKCSKSTDANNNKVIYTAAWALSLMVTGQPYYIGIYRTFMDARKDKQIRHAAVEIVWPQAQCACDLIWLHTEPWTAI